MKIKILLKTSQYVVVHKPHGLVVYADSKKDEAISLQNILQEQLGYRVIPIHRLDKTTCGVILYALNPQSAARLKQMFQKKQIKKKYIALCHGEIQDNLKIDKPLKKHKLPGTEQAVTAIQKLAQVSLNLCHEERLYSLVECSPETGRYHQIRRHLKSAGHPIVGDPLYGNSWNNKAFFEQFQIERTLLSAVFVSFQDPWSKKEIKIRTQPDFDFANLLNKLSLKA